MVECSRKSVFKLSLFGVKEIESTYLQDALIGKTKDLMMVVDLSSSIANAFITALFAAIRPREPFDCFL